MNLNAITETIRQQRLHITMMDKALNNLEASVENYKNVQKSEYYEVFGGPEQRFTDLQDLESIIISCSNTVNTSIRIIELTKVELIKQEARS